MNQFGFFLSFLLVVNLTTASQLLSVISSSESSRLADLFKGEFTDVESAYYSVVGLKSLGLLGDAEKKSACILVKNVDTTSVNSLGFAGLLYHELKSSCKVDKQTEKAIEFLEGKLESSNTPALCSAVSFLTAVGHKVDSDKVASLFVASLKNDNSVLMSSLALSALSKVPGADLDSFVNSIDVEDMVAQADEIDSKYLHFENDLETTSTFLSAVFDLSEATNKKPLITSDQIVQLTNFVLRTKGYTQSVKDAAMILKTVSKIAASKHVVVAKGEVISGTSISDNRPKLQILFNDVFSKPVNNLKVKVETVIRADDNEALISNTPFKFDGLRLYELQVWDYKPLSGFYDVSINIQSSDGQSLTGLISSEFRVKVTAKVVLKNVEIGTAEKDETTGTLNGVEYPGKAVAFKADKQQRILMKFQVEDQTNGNLVLPHQAFVRFEHRNTNQNIIFVAEADKTSTYKFEIDLMSAGKDQFKSLSGLYSVSLIIGDATISNPISWNLCDVTLKLGESSEKSKSAAELLYSQKEEIKHVFRKPEKRPPVLVSQAFTLACILPFIGLLVSWKIVGANLSGFEVSPKHLIFHLGVGGIFVLYYLFWIKLNMFETIRYLALVGSVTFVFGNRVLSEMANRRS